MSDYSKEELENMIKDVLNVIGLSDEIIERHQKLGTPPAELVQLVLDEKDIRIEQLWREVQSLIQ